MGRPAISSRIKLRSRSAFRGASAVQMLVIGGAVALGVVGGAVSFGKGVGEKAKCLGKTVVSLSSTGACPSSASSISGAAQRGDEHPSEQGPLCTSENGLCASVCFEAGTLVRTRAGLVAIEHIDVGTWVMARDAVSGQDRACRVVATMRSVDQPTRAIELVRDGLRDVLRVTDAHPFWVDGRGWVPAAALEVGRMIRAVAGFGCARVVGIDAQPRRATVYNVEVEDCHTYFVGTLQVLVHNDCDPSKPGSKCADSPGPSVESLYLKHLNRGAKPDEIAHWEGHQKKGVDIEKEIERSVEAETRRSISDLYQMYLGRRPTPQEITNWTNSMAREKKSLADVEQGIAKSEEAARAKQPGPPFYRGPYIANGQNWVDDERKKLSNERYSYNGPTVTFTAGGGDKTKQDPETIWDNQIEVNKAAADLLKSNVPQSEKDALAKALLKAKIRDTRSMTASERDELTRHANLHGPLPPEDAARRKAWLEKPQIANRQSTVNCHGGGKGECFVDLTSKDAFADKSQDLRRLFPDDKKKVTLDDIMAGRKKWEKGVERTDERIESGLDQSARDLRAAVVDSAMKSGDPELRAQAAALVAPPPFDPSETFTKSLAAASGSEDAKGAMKRLGDLMRARQLANDPQFQHYVDAKDIDAQVHALLQNKQLIEEMSKLQEQARQATKKSWQYQQQVNYLASDDFDNHLALLPPDKAKALLASELTKIAAIDPEKARDLLAQMEDRAVGRWVDTLSDDELIDRLGALEERLGGNGAELKNYLKGGKGAVDVTKRGAKTVSSLGALKNLLKARSSRDGSVAAAKRFAETEAGHSMVGRLIAPIGELDVHGKVSGRAALLGLALSGFDYYNGKLGKGGKEDLDVALSIMKTVDAHDAFAKWIAWGFFGKELPKDCKGLQRVAGLKLFGPAADLIGGGVDLMRGADSFSQGNDARGFYQTLAGGGQVVSAVTGFAIYFFALTGPVAPGILLVATVAIVVGKVGEMTTAKGPEVEFLREKGLLAPLPPQVRSERDLASTLSKQQDQVRAAELALSRAEDILNRPGAHSRTELDRALDVKNQAQGALWVRQADVAKTQKQLDGVRAELQRMNINPRDWDGQWPEDKAARAQRNEASKRFLDGLEMQRGTIPLGR